jgi:hypothetical protein
MHIEPQDRHQIKGHPWTDEKKTKIEIVETIRQIGVMQPRRYLRRENHVHLKLVQMVGRMTAAM